MKPTLLRGWILMLTMMWSMGSLLATHVDGLEMWHEDLGIHKVRVFIGYYLDCAGGGSSSNLPPTLANAPTNVQIAGQAPAGCTLSPIGSMTIKSYVEVTPLCPGTTSSCAGGISPIPGTAYAVAFCDYDLGVCTSSQPFIFYYSTCCRTNALTSVPPGSLAISIRHDVYPQVQNHSPVVKPVPMYFCKGQVSQIPMTAFDPDGDSLVYVLDSCLANTNLTTPLTFSSVDYIPGYSPTEPLGPGYDVQLDPVSGMLTITPLTGGIENGIVGVRIDEYRNGSVIGSTYRDLRVSMAFCYGAQNPPQISGPVNVSGAELSFSGEVKYCPGSSLTFDLIATDPDPADSISWIYDLANFLPGATVASSGSNPDTLTLSWSPGMNDTLPQWVSFIARDGNCPFPLSDAMAVHLTPTGTCISSTIVGTNCQDSTGSIAINMFGSPGPFSFLWNDGSTLPKLLNIPVGKYWVDIVDSSDMTMLTDTFYLTADDISVSIQKTPSSCDVPTGVMTAIVNGGTAPYNYQWSNGATAASNTGLLSGGYSVLVTDANGCIQQAVDVLDPPDSCWVEISGTLFQDLNNNCVKDPGEAPLPGILVDLSPGGMALTDTAGRYRFLVDTGAYSVTVFSQPYLGTNCPAGGYSLSLPSYDDDTTTINFGVEISQYLDLILYLGNSVSKWNDTIQYDISILNYGGFVSPPFDWTLEYNTGLKYLYALEFPQMVDTVGGVVKWQSTGGAPLGYCAPAEETWVRFLVDSSEFAIGDVFQAEAFTDSLVVDSFPLNNQSVKINTVLAAYDPNDKLVTPQGIGPKGFILKDTEFLDYTIRFQNTGNFPATVVVLRDTVSPHLNLAEYKTLGYSHFFELAVEEDSILVFTFNNIMLPDSASDPMGSQGYVAFRLGLQQGLPIGTEIRNSAAIYFDFNYPIYTNTTLNTLYIQPEVDLVAVGDYCEGEELYAYLVAPGKSPYIWEWSTGVRGNSQTGVDTVVVGSPGWYVVKIIDQWGFSDTDSVYVDATQLPISIGGWEVTGTNLEVQFVDSSLHASSWIWEFGDGALSVDSMPLYQYAAPGLYDVVLTVSNVCGMDTSQFQVNVEGVGIDSWPYGPVRVQPNPAIRNARIHFPSGDSWTLEVLDYCGRRILLQHVKGQDLDLPCETLPAGLYFLKVSARGHTRVLPLMISH